MKGFPSHFEGRQIANRRLGDGGERFMGEKALMAGDDDIGEGQQPGESVFCHRVRRVGGQARHCDSQPTSGLQIDIVDPSSSHHQRSPQARRRGHAVRR